MCVMLTSDVNCLFTPRSEENNGKKTEIIDQPRFHADTHSTSQKCPLISSLTPLFDSTNYLALFRSYQRAIIHCQTFSVARGERNAHFSVLAPRLDPWCRICVVHRSAAVWYVNAPRTNKCEVKGSIQGELIVFSLFSNASLQQSL